MGKRIHRFDWSATSLGPIGQWPQALRTSVSICLQSRFPLFVQWGPELLLIYNDAYTPILAAKHPALGRPMRVVWSDIWDVIGPMLGSVLATGRATLMDDQLLVLNRHGYREDAWFIHSYSPIRGDLGTIEGIFTAVVETTDKVVGNRRWRTLRDLAARALEQTRNAEEACHAAAATLAENGRDVPFALIYLLDADRHHVRLVAQANAMADASAAGDIPTDDPDSPIAAAARTGAAAVADVSHWPGLRLEGGHDAPREMVILPIAAPGQALPTALLVAGIHPRRPMDDAYHDFFRTAATHVATALAHARAYEEERRRPEIGPAREDAVHALRGSEELLRIATSNANLFTWEIDVSTGRASASENVTEIIGFPLPENLAGAFEIIHPADREQVIREYQEAITLGRPFHSDQRLINPLTGEIMHMRVDGTLISDGAAGRSRLVGISRNVTEERQAAEALRLSEERVRLATEAARVYTWELDLQTGAIVNSANAERVRGSPPAHDDEQGQALVHPDDLVYVTERRAAAIRTGELLDIEYRIVDRETGAIAWLRAQGNVVRDESGHPRRLVGVVQNVTAQKAAEEALRRSTEELEQRVQERTAELRCSAEALETLLEDRASLMRQLVRAEEEERQRIARELHDELGQPLTALQVGLGTLSTDAPDELRRLMAIVVEIDRNVERLAFDLRPLALTELGLEAAITHLVGKFRRESDVDVDLHVEIERERLEGMVETTLYRILQEALTNVWRHSGAASVSVIVDQRNDHLQMTVDDDGHGFDVEAVLHRRDGRRFGLLGIRQRVSLVRGTVDIESGPGRGTTLYVRVPLAREGEA